MVFGDLEELVKLSVLAGVEMLPGKTLLAGEQRITWLDCLQTAKQKKKENARKSQRNAKESRQSDVK